MTSLRLVQVQESEALSDLKGGFPFFPHVVEPDPPPADPWPDADAFNALVQRLTPGVKGIAHQLGTRSKILDEDDLTQMALVHLWDLFSQGTVADKTSSYLLQGCAHYLRNQLRSRPFTSKEFRLDHVQFPGGWDGNPGEEAADYQSLDDTVQHDLLLQSLENAPLTEREKAVLSQRIDGLTVREIGERLGVSHVSVIKIIKSIRAKISAAWRG